MRIRKTLSPRTLSMETRLATAFGFAVCLTLLACSVNVKKDSSGEDKKVDIETPIGGIHVDKEADVHDTGLAVYPGARIKPEQSSHQDKDANVDISFLGYGVKVVAIEYQSDDAPDKIVAYYKDQLRKYGNVLECHTTGHNVQMDQKDDSRDLACDSHGGKTVELKVGSKENQHVVAIDPDGKGSSFALVYVRTNKGTTI
jgi:hypothetical protein